MNTPCTCAACSGTGPAYPLAMALEVCLGTHEGLRRLRFLPEEIFVATVPMARGTMIAVVLRADGKEAVLHIGLVAEDAQAIAAAWLRAVTDWNTTMAESERQRIWRRFRDSDAGLALVVAVSIRGLTRLPPPNVVPRPEMN